MTANWYKRQGSSNFHSFLSKRHIETPVTVEDKDHQKRNRHTRSVKFSHFGILSLVNRPENCVEFPQQTFAKLAQYCINCLIFNLYQRNLTMERNYIVFNLHVYHISLNMYPSPRP